jgi:hypothetical protein
MPSADFKKIKKLAILDVFFDFNKIMTSKNALKSSLYRIMTFPGF